MKKQNQIVSIINFFVLPGGTIGFGSFTKPHPLPSPKREGVTAAVSFGRGHLIGATKVVVSRYDYKTLSVSLSREIGLDRGIVSLDFLLSFISLRVL